MRKLTYLSFFSGVGGFDLGFDRVGMECIGQIEIDGNCRRILNRHWPEKLKGNDVEKYSHDGPIPEVICGGFPCQDLSVAGKRAGLAGERSGLWFAFRDVVGRLKPRIVVIENVPGLLSSHEGRDFALLLHGLAELGYRFASRVLDSQYLGVPQRRRRVFIVGSLGDGSCAEILFEPESVRGDSAPSRAPREGIAGSTSPCLSASGGGTQRAGESRGQDCVIPCGTLDGKGDVRGNANESDKLVVAGTLSKNMGECGTANYHAEQGLYIPDTCKTLTSEGVDGSSNGDDQGMPIICGALSPGAHPGECAAILLTFFGERREITLET